MDKPAKNILEQSGVGYLLKDVKLDGLKELTVEGLKELDLGNFELAIDPSGVPTWTSRVPTNKFPVVTFPSISGGTSGGPAITLERRKPMAPVAPPLDKRLLVFGGRVLEHLRSSPSAQRPMYELVDATDIELDKLLPLVNELVDLELVTIVSRNKHGNHIVGLAEDVRQLTL